MRFVKTCSKSSGSIKNGVRFVEYSQSTITGSSGQRATAVFKEQDSDLLYPSLRLQRSGKSQETVDQGIESAHFSGDVTNQLRAQGIELWQSLRQGFCRTFDDPEWVANFVSQTGRQVPEGRQPLRAPRREREIIETALAETRGRVSGPSGAAAKLGIPPSTLETRIKALKINKGQFKFH